MRRFRLRYKKVRVLLFSLVMVIALGIILATISFGMQRDASQQKNQTDEASRLEDINKSNQQKSGTSGLSDSKLSNQVSEDSSASNQTQQDTNRSPQSTANKKQESSNPVSASVTQTDYQPVPPNPYCPTPTFSLSVALQPNSTNMVLTATASADDPNLRPECGGSYNYFWPVVTPPSNGSLCSGTVYSIGSNNSWGVACAFYGNVPYGSYTYTFSVTASNGYAKMATRSTSYTYNYVQQ